MKDVDVICIVGVALFLLGVWMMKNGGGDEAVGIAIVGAIIMFLSLRIDLEPPP